MTESMGFLLRGADTAAATKKSPTALMLSNVAADISNSKSHATTEAYATMIVDDIQPSAARACRDKGSLPARHPWFDPSVGLQRATPPSGRAGNHAVSAHLALQHLQNLR